jgi:5'-nucleotidase/UDP-sugar diphosphatase
MKRPGTRSWHFWLFALSLLLFPVATHAQAVAADPSIHHLVILHTNDTHGHPVKFSYQSVPGVGGLPARSTLVKQIRKANDRVLLLDGGDLNSGMAESNLFKAKPDIEGFNHIDYDAMVLGNHEFDQPRRILRQQMEWARFPFLCANIKTADGQYLARPYIIKDFEGIKVAVFGLTTTETSIIGHPNHIWDLRFEDEIEAARRLVPKLRKKADVIIALTHMGIYPSRKRGSKRLGYQVRGIDVIVDGHTHTRIVSPIIIRHKSSGRTTLIVQAWKWGLVLGRLDLWIRNRAVVDWRFQAIPVNLKGVEKKPDGTDDVYFIGREIREDESLLNILQPYVEETRQALSQIVGHAEGPFITDDIREQETPAGDIIADSMLWYTKALNPDFAFQNGGGIREDLPKGPITRKSIYEMLPFDNTVVVLTLRGIDARALFDFMATTRGEGAFPQVSKGVEFAIRAREQACENILIKGRPLDTEKTYRIATNSYLAYGGDGYRVLLRAVERLNTRRLLRDVFVDYLKHLGGRIRPEVKGRIRVVPPRPNRKDKTAAYRTSPWDRGQGKQNPIAALPPRRFDLPACSRNWPVHYHTSRRLQPG